MSHQSPNAQFVEELTKASRKLRTLFDARVKTLGLTLARARTLLFLQRFGVLNQRELAEKLEIETPTMVRLLDGLEVQSFIERQAVEGDRRAKQIVMTPIGAELAKKVDQLAQALRAEYVGQIDETELLTAIKVLRAVNRNIGDLIDKSWAQ